MDLISDELDEKFLGKILKFDIVLDDTYIQYAYTLQFAGKGVQNSVGFARPDIKINARTRWTEEERQSTYADMMSDIAKLLISAKVRSISELVGKPIEVTVNRKVLKSFRMLEEVL